MEAISEYENQFFLQEAFIDEDGVRYPFSLDNHDGSDDEVELDGNGRPYTPCDRSFNELDDLETVSLIEFSQAHTQRGFDREWLASFMITLRLWMETRCQTRRNVRCPSTRRTYHLQRTTLIAMLVLSVSLFLSEPVQSATHENVIFESIGEMAGATSYLHVQATISLSSLTQQFELYKNKLKARFTDPHRVSQVMNAQFAKNLNVSVNRYLDGKREQEPGGRSPFEASSIVPAPHMNTAVVWTRIAQLHF